MEDEPDVMVAMEALLATSSAAARAHAAAEAQVGCLFIIDHARQWSVNHLFAL